MVDESRVEVELTKAAMLLEASSNDILAVINFEVYYKEIALMNCISCY
jgi:hypothetical protein